MRTIHPAFFVTLLLFLLQAGCTSVPTTPSCPQGTQILPDCPPASAIPDEKIEQIYASRTWKPPDEVGADPVEFGVNFDVPVQGAQGKILGPDDEGAIDSLAAKLWMIENAEHTIDLVYYIFTPDIVGYAMIGAMCDAVQRGVDIRFMVDSLGSLELGRSTLAALQSCEKQAGFMRNEKGELTTRKARVQVVIFNAVTRISTSPNRRSHDKLLISDADFSDKALMISGGRNISLDYYGFDAEGNYDPYGYRDSEILFRPAETENDMTIGELSAGYFNLLFLFRGNKVVIPVNNDDAHSLYASEQAKARDSLARLKQFELLKPHLDHMTEFMTQGFHLSDALLAFNLGNLTNENVTRDAVDNLAENPNSILYVLGRIGDTNDGSGTVRIVSPYLFLARYEDDEGNVLVDEAARTNNRKGPGARRPESKS